MKSAQNLSTFGVSRTKQSYELLRCYVNDGGRSSGITVHAGVSNYRKVLCPKGKVTERYGKSLIKRLGKD